MKFDEKILGKNLYLERPKVTSEFAKALFSVIDKNREFLLPWLEWVDAIKSSDDVYDRLKQKDYEWSIGQKVEYVLFGVENSDIVGALWVHRIDEDNRFVELGYWLSKNFSGKGLMKEAIKLLEEELFSKGIERVIIRNDTQNENSINLAKSLGYFLEGVERHDRYSKLLKNFRSHNVFTKLSAEFYNK